MVCISNREWAADKLFRRNWTLETEEDKADFIIATERWDCNMKGKHRLIDEVRRLDTPFAWIYATDRPSGTGTKRTF